LTEGPAAYLPLLYKTGKSRIPTLLLHLLGFLTQWIQPSTLLFTWTLLVISKHKPCSLGFKMPKNP